MINEEIISYIQSQLRKNVSKGVITSKLANVGWHSDDIEEAFRKLTPPEVKKEVKVETTTVEKPDPYREFPVSDKTQDIGPKLEVNKLPVEASPIPKPIFAQSFSEANSKNESGSYYIPTNMTRPKIPEGNKVEEPRTTNFNIMKPKVVEVGETSSIAKPPVDVVPSTNQEFIPKLIPKIEDRVEYKKPVSSASIPTNALLYSYPQDLSASRPKETIITPVKKTNVLKWIFLIVVISFIAGAVFAFLYKKPNLSFIKKDPKVLLVKAPEVLSALKSYKIDTEATISIPAFADITNGLVNGEAINSNNKDHISLIAKGMVNNTKPTPVFDYSATIKSSIFKDDINSGIKYGSGGTFIVTPDLRKLFGKNAPTSNTVLVDNGQFGLLTNLLPEIIEPKANKINFDKIFSIGLPSYVTSETDSIFKDFLTTASVLEKDPETIHGIENYHYVLSSDRQSTKKFLSNFTTIFLNELSKEEKISLDEGIGSTSLDSLEIWIGKDDGNIHQYRFILTTPLSKIIGLDDKGIAGSVVTFDWKTTYYDFDINNDIALPGASIDMIDFIKKIEDMKLRDLVSSFKQAADIFRNATGSYGKRTNPNGSCVNPNPSSLFSPVGHAKGANNAVGNISEILNNILSTTNGVLSCYSLPNAWAISAPLLSDSNSFVCLDSTGKEEVLEKPISGPSCK